jgi:hypothetical protein
MFPCKFRSRKHELIKGSEFHIFTSNKILGTAQEFCQSLYHIKETPECDQKIECINDNKCSPKVCIALVEIDGFVSRYSNCADKMHAEDYLVQDQRLLEKIKSSRGMNMSCYLTLQPCHFSSNNTDKSCTNTLVQFYERELKPRGISFDLVIAYPYRTHWEILDDEEMKKFGKAIANGKLGIKILKSTIGVRAFTEQDWQVVLKHCQDSVVISPNRLAMDSFTKSIIEKYS